MVVGLSAEFVQNRTITAAAVGVTDKYEKYTNLNKYNFMVQGQDS